MSNNTDGAQSPVGQTTKITHEAVAFPSRPNRQTLHIVVEATRADADDTLSPRINPAKRHFLRNNLEQWLRFGCERVIQIGGQTACFPISREITFSDFDRPSNGYHEQGSCADPQRSEGCLIHDLFGEGDRMSLQLVTHRSTHRHLWEVTLTCPRPADIGLLTEAIHYLDSSDVSAPYLGTVEAQLVNPLYDDIETLRNYQCRGSTVEMIRKNGRWRDTVRERYISALRDCLAVSDQLAPAIYPGDTDE